MATGPPEGFWSRFLRLFRVRSKDVQAACAQTYYQNVEADYRSLAGLPGVREDAEARAIAESITAKSKANPNDLRVADAILFERMVIRLLSDELLRRKALTVRERYRRLVEPAEYQAYLESKPPDSLAGDPALLRADLDELLGRFLWIYTLAPFREEMRNTLSIKIVNRLVILLALVFGSILLNRLLLVWAAEQDRSTTLLSWSIPSLLIVTVAGAIGGFISVQQRIQSAPPTEDAIRGVLSLYSGWFSVYLSPVTGAVSAILLYLLFVGDFLKGSTFPEIAADAKARPDFQAFLYASGPADGIAYAKLIIWGFIAGFAERLVPDTLTRLVKSVPGREETKPAVNPAPQAPGPGTTAGQLVAGPETPRREAPGQPKIPQ